MGAAAFVVESPQSAAERGLQPICEVLASVTANSAFHGTRLDVDHVGQVMESLITTAEARGIDRTQIAPQTVFVSHETYTPARGGSAAAEINALRRVFGDAASSIVITNTKGFTGHAMGAGIEDVVAIKALETGIVPPVPNYKEPDPELGTLNLSVGGAYPVNYALRLAAGFGSQIAMTLLRWTPMPDGRRRTPSELGYAYRIVDKAAWERWLADAAGRAGAVLEVDHRRLRIVDAGAPSAAPAAPSVPEAPAAPVPAPAAPEAPAAPSTPTADPLTAQVVGIVSEMTGYPPELLDVDLDLEADLGVDTVKQAEVFAAVREQFGVERDENLQLRDFPTLTHVIGWVRDKTGATPVTMAGAATVSAPTAASSTAPKFVGDFAAVDELPRRVPLPAMRPSLTACVPTGVELGAGSRILVVLDEGGVGAALVKKLAKRGAEILAVEAATATDELLAQVAKWSTEQPLTGVYWLASLDDEGPLGELDLDSWREALRRRVVALHALFHQVIDAEPFLVTGSRLGGFHGHDADGATAPLGGAVVGFAKSYKRERPDVLVKAVDFPASRKTTALADVLVDETLADPGCVEIGRVDDQRWGVGLAEVPFPPVDSPEPGAMDLGTDSVFLITGAAGSIVSAITADLATHSGGTFHLLDLAPAPDPADADLQQYLADPNSLKTTIAEQIAARGEEKPTPVLIEKELARFERLASALSAIDAVTSAGGTVHYHSVDLRDGKAMT